jgi:hypothetical protein
LALRIDWWSSCMFAPLKGTVPNSIA